MKVLSGIIIRQMDIEDYEKVSQLWNETFGKAVSLEFDSSSRIDTYLKRNPKMSTVALFHDDIIGTVLCGHDGRRGTIYHVSISEEHRGKGIAKRMVERSISCLKEEGIDNSVLFAHTYNTNAIKYWEKNGWIPSPDVLYHSKYF